MAKKTNINIETIYNKFVEKGLNNADVYGFTWCLNEFGKDKNWLYLMYNEFVYGLGFQSGDELSNSELMATSLLELVNMSGNVTSLLDEYKKNSSYLSSIDLNENDMAKIVDFCKRDSLTFVKTDKKYNKEGILVISGLAAKLNISEEKLYSQFVDMGINSADMWILSDAFAEYRKEEDCINLMYEYSRGSRGVIRTYDGSSIERISNALKSLIELSEVKKAA